MFTAIVSGYTPIAGWSTYSQPVFTFCVQCIGGSRSKTRSNCLIVFAFGKLWAPFIVDDLLPPDWLVNFARNRKLWRISCVIVVTFEHPISGWGFELSKTWFWHSCLKRYSSTSSVKAKWLVLNPGAHNFPPPSHLSGVSQLCRVKRGAYSAVTYLASAAYKS